jgi:D-alanyl-D-alanine carboxypeptidase/D-alanyl-D-alanine-endopeptidase (penicillin-binding protein 4)
MLKTTTFMLKIYKAMSHYNYLIKKTKAIAYIALISSLITGCGGVVKVQQKNIHKHFKGEGYENQMTGLVVIDPENNDTIVNINGSQYFIPASNTKIFTLFTALELLPEKMPLFRYQKKGIDSILISGMGNPTPFHPFFKDSSLVSALAQYTHVGIVANKLLDFPYGPGWAWEDYDTYYAPERAALPLYGNVFNVIKNDSVSIQEPSLFASFVKKKDDEKQFYRSAEKNVFYLPEKETLSLEIPYKTSDSLTAILLGNLLKKEIFILPEFTDKTDIAYGISTDSVLERMMEVSDNFLAEQLLLSAAEFTLDSMQVSSIQKYILKGSLKDLAQQPRWVDGSGLSRYNLFTPLSITQVLHKMYLKYPWDKLIHFFPAGGEKGTLNNWFKGEQKPYIYAKTGSLGNTYCLSGFLITKNNKRLIFSYMNNHFTKPISQIKQEMEMVLEAIRDQY